MVILIDADSLVYSCSYGVESKDEAFDKFDNHIISFVSEIEEEYGPDSNVIIFHGNKGNFRYDIDPDYKANRKGDKPEHYNDLSEYVKTAYNAVSAEGEEVDDLVARHWHEYRKLGVDSVIVSIDKDYLQLPAKIFNYNKRKHGIVQVSEKEAMHNFYVQMVTGDAADNVNYLKGKGIKYAEALFEGVTSRFGYIRRLLSVFREVYGGKAKEKYIAQQRLLKLRLEK